MKRLFYILLTSALLWIPVRAFAGSVTLAWDPPPDADLAGYRLYMSDTPGRYTFGAEHALADIPANLTQITVEVPTDRRYFVVTAYDGAGNESGPSNEVSVDLPPGAPLNLTVTVKVEITMQGASQ